VRDVEVGHDRDLMVLAAMLILFGFLSILCCVGGFFWAVFA
jgi:hypothetical protein